MKIVARELPIERLAVSIGAESSRESVEPRCDRIEVREVVRRQRFALQDRKVDLDLVKPARVHWQRYSSGVAELLAKALWKRRRPVRTPLVDDPEYPTS